MPFIPPPSVETPAAACDRHDVISRPRLRSVHPVAQGDTISVAFDGFPGPPLRLVLDCQTAARLVETMQTYLGAWRMGIKLHSETSSAIPSPDGSPNDGQNVTLFDEDAYVEAAARRGAERTRLGLRILKREREIRAEAKAGAITPDRQLPTGP